MFKNRFQVPMLEIGKRIGKDVYFDLNIQSGHSAILPNQLTPTLGINQSFLGVTLRANKGDRVHIKVKNSLDKTTTTTLAWDETACQGRWGPHQPIQPSGTRLSGFDIVQNAATLWYRSHQIHQTGKQVYQGLAGMFIIDDESAKNLNLPMEYGVDDFPVIIQDKDFNKNGASTYIRSMSDRMMGKKGQTVLVNGVINPVLKAKKSLLCLRLLNGSNARTYRLSFDDHRDFYIIGSDGGLLERSVKANSLRLAPAERVEILLDVANGKMPILKHNASQASSGMGMMSRMMNQNKDLSIFQIDASSVQKKQPKHS
ncbi:multicopper oxidase family protein [Isorropodon fossajaponicum symbiont]|uniref:multicopper oxidase family protein n=1 Tax=Isorropodon fossajaponicum symbiont TaxID=883811 RepID=UPI00191591D1|nr:multicopper oxidase domain-containing protein [Isorropodon fossajaponicum symbiont]